MTEGSSPALGGPLQPAERMQLAMGVNPAYLPYAAAVVRSCLDHDDGSRLAFHLLHDGGLSEALLSPLRTMVQREGAVIDFHALGEDVICALPASAWFEPIVSMRLLLPRLLTDVERVIYLDADVVVLDSLEPLWAMALDGRSLGAVKNVVETEMYDHVLGLGLDPSNVLNSGVLLLDLARIRASGAVERMLEIPEWCRPALVWPDQDVLNLVFRDIWLPLHPRWNAQNSLSVFRERADAVFGADLVSEALAKPAIRHFEGPSLCKPWHYLCTAASVAEFRAALARTPWGGSVELEDRTLGTRIIKRLPADAQIPVYFRFCRWRASFRARLARAKASVSSVGYRVSSRAR